MFVSNWQIEPIFITFRQSDPTAYNVDRNAFAMLKFAKLKNIIPMALNSEYDIKK